MTTLTDRAAPASRAATWAAQRAATRSATRAASRKGNMRAFDVYVAAVTPLSPTFVRLTFAGHDLADFADPGPLGVRDLRIKLLVPAGDDPTAWRAGRPAGWPAEELAELADGWYLRWKQLDPADRGVMRTYTVRRTRLGLPVPEVDVDFVLHADHGDGVSGPAAAWAAAARPGDPATLLGPTRGAAPAVPVAEDAAGEGAADPLLGYGGVEWRPPAPDLVSRVLLVGDETAAPAICSILEGGALRQDGPAGSAGPAGYQGHAVIEVPTAADVLPLDVPAGIEVRWLVRGEAPRGALALTAVREICAADPHPRAGDRGEELPEVDVDAELLWENGVATQAEARPGPFAWVAGEAAMVRDIRRHLVGEACLERSRVVFMGYWREGKAALG